MALVSTNIYGSRKVAASQAGEKLESAVILRRSTDEESCIALKMLKTRSCAAFRMTATGLGWQQLGFFPQPVSPASPPLEILYLLCDGYIFPWIVCVSGMADFYENAPLLIQVGWRAERRGGAAPKI
jgi:hypothetical protein